MIFISICTVFLILLIHLAYRLWTKIRRIKITIKLDNDSDPSFLYVAKRTTVQKLQDLIEKQTGISFSQDKLSLTFTNQALEPNSAISQYIRPKTKISPIFEVKMASDLKITVKINNDSLSLKISPEMTVKQLQDIIEKKQNISFADQKLSLTTASNQPLEPLSTISQYIPTDDKTSIVFEVKRKVVRVLSLDGGGIRGVAVARILEEIEAQTKKQIHELFDVIVGTSTGGILTLVLSVPGKANRVLTATEAKELYVQNGKNIFSQKNLGVLEQKYTGEELEAVIHSYYNEDTTLQNAILPMGVVVTRMDKATPILINSTRAKLHPDDFRHNSPVWRVARATSAAPSYFPVMNMSTHLTHRGSRSPDSIKELTLPPTYQKNEVPLQDGGIAANNPAHLGLKYATSCLKVLNDAEYNFEVVSIGTGTLSGLEEEPRFNPRRNQGIVNMGKDFLDDPYDINKKAYFAHEKVKVKYFDNREGVGSGYFRVQFPVTEEQLNNMDNAETRNINSLIESAEKYIYTEDKNGLSEHFQGVIGLLSEQNIVRPQGLKSYFDECMQKDQAKRIFCTELYQYFKCAKEASEENQRLPRLIDDINNIVNTFHMTHRGRYILKNNYLRDLAQEMQNKFNQRLQISIERILRESLLIHIGDLNKQHKKNINVDDLLPGPEFHIHLNINLENILEAGKLPNMYLWTSKEDVRKKFVSFLHAEIYKSNCRQEVFRKTLEEYDKAVKACVQSLAVDEK